MLRFLRATRPREQRGTDQDQDIARVRLLDAAWEHAGMVVLKTGIGGSRVVDMLPRDQLPRIC